MKDGIPVLRNWVTATQVAEELGVTRQRVNKMITNGDFKSVHILEGSKMYVVQRVEVEKLKLARAGGTEVAEPIAATESLTFTG